MKLNDIIFLSNKFLALESEFKKLFPHRSNCLVILLLFIVYLRNTIIHFEYVVAQKKKTVLITIINNLLKNIENY